MRRLFAAVCVVLSLPALAEDPAARWWWDQAWWEAGALPATATHPVVTRNVGFQSGDVEVNAIVFRPAGKGKFPAVLYQHGRRGLDELVQLQARRLAARGFVVLAPDVFNAHMIEPYPIEHDPRLEQDVNRALDVLLALPDVSTKRACLASLSRGGYMTLKVAVAMKRQERDVACYVSWYPHWQDPNAPEPLQVYSFAPEAERLAVPTLVFIGEDEQYQRKHSIEEAFKALSNAKRPAQLVVYPGVGRGFDFRPPHIRTFADDLAAKDAIARAAAFMRQHLTP